MARKRYAAMAAALSLCVATSCAVQADTVLPKADALDVMQAKGTLFSRTSSAREAFAGPYDLLVAETADRNSLGMILASMGLMVLIANRRRMPS